MWVGGQRHAPTASHPGKTQYPLYRRYGGPQGRSGGVRKISPPPGFGPRTVQPVARYYTDWNIPAPYFQSNQRYLLYVTIQINLLIDVLCSWAIKSELPYRD